MNKLLIMSIAVSAFALGASAQWMRLDDSPGQIVKDIIEDNGVLYIGVNRSGVFKSGDGGATWDSLNTGMETWESRAINEILVSEDTLWAATDDGIYRSENGGASWTKRSTGIPIGGGAVHEFTLSLFEHNGSLFTGAWTGIYRSDDRGASWYVVNTDTPGVGPKDFEEHHGLLFAARESINTPYAYISTDDGATWSAYNTVEMPTISFYSDGNNLWCTTIDGVHLSTDDGATWERRGAGLPPDPYNSDILRLNGYLFTSMENAFEVVVLRSANEGITWEDCSEGISNEVFSTEMLFVFNDKLLVGTSNGLWQRDTSMTVESTFESTAPIVKSPQLIHSYPNPFNASTTISFQVPELAQVRLTVNNLLGQSVKELINERLTQGAYSVNFEAGDLPSGIYLVSLASGHNYSTQRIVLLK